MELITLPFSVDPAAYTASHLLQEGLDPLHTLVISPTERFKTYLALQLLELGGGECIAPFLITSSALITSLAALRGLPVAGDMEKLSMLFRACRETSGLDGLFPGEQLANFPAFIVVAGRLLSTFEELGKEERSIDENAIQELIEAGSWAQRHLSILCDLLNNYWNKQQEASAYDSNLLLKEIGEQDIQHFFNDYERVMLLVPLSLTSFEKRVFGAIDDKLTVIHQDTPEYDFSAVSTFRAGSVMEEPHTEPVVHLLEVPSRMAQVMRCLAVIKDEIDAGVQPGEIAVVNIDPQFSEMLYGSLESVGIDANYSEGMGVKKSPLYQLLLQGHSFFHSGLDALMFLELAGGELFARLAGCSLAENRAACRSMRREVVRRRIFRFSSLDMGFIRSHKGWGEAISLLHELYGSEDFEGLYRSLHRLLLRLQGRKAYEFYAVRDALLSSALELCDLDLEARQSPFEIFLQYAGSKRFPLLGSYLRGVQILGLLETRGINFRVVVVPSFNEGFFPVQRQGDLFLPTTARRALGLPSFLEREELELYYLKRLVDGSARSYLISIDDPGGEIDVRCRFSHLFKDCAKHPGAVPGEGAFVPMYVLPVRGETQVRTRQEISAPVLSRPIREFSRLDIERIKRCQTQYYIAKVLGVKETEGLGSGIEPDLVGQLVHSIFNKLYCDLEFSPKGVDLKAVETRLFTLFEEHFREGFFHTREEELLKRIQLENLRQAVQCDVERFREGYRVCVEYSERELSGTLKGGQDHYTLTGRIDRVDLCPSGGYSIIDYKTGSIPDRREHLGHSGFRHVQLGLYGILFRLNSPSARIERLSYFDVNSRKDMVTIIGPDEVNGYLAEVEGHIVELLDRFNSKEKLSLAADPLSCTRCPYDTICRVYER